MGKRFGWVFAMTALSVAQARPAFADPTPADKTMATQLFDDAEKLLASGDIENACAKYSESNRLDPQLGTLLHAADCFERAGKIASAWSGFKEAAEIAARRNATGQNEPREQLARARAEALESKLPHLRINVPNPVPGLEVLEDDRPVGQAAWGSAFPIDPGQHVVTARAPDHKPFTNVFEVGANGGQAEVVVPLLEAEAPPPAAARPPLAPPPRTAGAGPSAPGAPADASPTDRSGHGQTAGFILLGTGVAAAGVGAVFGLMRNSKVEERDKICPTSVHCTPDEGSQISSLTSTAKTDAMISNVAFGVGGAAAVVGLYLVLTGKSSDAPKAATSLHVEPWTSSSLLGGSIGASW